MHMPAAFMYGFAAMCAMIACAAARWPAMANMLAAAATLIVAAAWDPLNDAGLGIANGRVVEATIDLAAYGSIPFVFGTMLQPRLDVLMLAVLGHAVSKSRLATIVIIVQDARVQ
jgi:hypothetical protein